jgi:hypothetical protein
LLGVEHFAEELLDARAGFGVAAGALPKITYGQAKKEEIIIGVSAPLTGGNASVGQHAKNSIEMGFEEINEAGGIKSLGGRKIKVLFGNDEGKPESGMAEAERLISGRSVSYDGRSWAASGIVLPGAAHVFLGALDQAYRSGGITCAFWSSKMSR